MNITLLPTMPLENSMTMIIVNSIISSAYILRLPSEVHAVHSGLLALQIRYHILASCCTGFRHLCLLPSSRQLDPTLKMPSSGMLRLVTLVRTDISKERIAYIIRVTGIGELSKTLTISSKRSTVLRLLVTANIFLAHRFLSLWWWRRYVPPKRMILKEPWGVTSQKTAFFIVTAVKHSNLTFIQPCFNL
jgi:hypothetical protein